MSVPMPGDSLLAVEERSIVIDAVRLLTRISVFLLAVAVVPLLRFIDLDANRQAYAVEGLSKQDSPGVVVDRKERLRYVSRVRATAQPSHDDDFAGFEADLPGTTLRALPSTTWVAEPSSTDVPVPRSAARGVAQPRGPPA